MRIVLLTFIFLYSLAWGQALYGQPKLNLICDSSKCYQRPYCLTVNKKNQDGVQLQLFQQFFLTKKHILLYNQKAPQDKGFNII